MRGRSNVPLPEGLQPQTIVSLAESDIVAPPCYMEPSVLPIGGQLILASQAKTGKSFMMLEMGRALACADQPFASPDLYCPRACKVLLIEQELGAAGLKKRTEKLYTKEEIRRQGFMAENFLYVSKQPELKLDSDKGIRLIYEICGEVQPDVLMLDPLGRFHNLDENSNQEVSGLWGTIDKLQKAFPGMALITSMHSGKPVDSRSGLDDMSPYIIRGASKNFDNVDAIITTKKTHELATEHKSWAVLCRFTLRHGEAPDDMLLHFNERNDSRVRHYHVSPTKPLAAPSTGWPNKKQAPATQDGFGFKSAQ